MISSEKIIEIKALGVKTINSELHAELSDRFRIGSNTKSYSREVMPRETADQLVNAFQLNFIFNNFFSNIAKPFKRNKTSVDDGSSGF